MTSPKRKPALMIFFMSGRSRAVCGIEASKAYGKPVVCNEDDKIGPVGAEAARLSILSGAGWARSVDRVECLHTHCLSFGLAESAGAQRGRQNGCGEP